MKFYISNLRVLSTCAVIIVHITAGLFSLFPKSSELWSFNNLIDSSVRFCVPVFVMISGAVLLGRDENMNYFLTKRLRRILSPFVFYSFIYFMAAHIHEGVDRSTIVIFISEMLQGTSYHLWYIYMIIGLYLFIPFISPWILKSSRREIELFLVIWVFTLLDFSQFGITPRFDLTYFGKYIGYLILGFYIDRFVEHRNHNYYLGILLFIIGTFWTFLGTEHISNSAGKLDDKFYNYLTLNVAVQAAGVFILFKQKATQPSKLTLEVDQMSYGIYLIHILILSTVYTFFPNEVLKTTKSALYLLGYVVCTSILTLCLSFIAVKLIKKIKFLRKLAT